MMSLLSEEFLTQELGSRFFFSWDQFSLWEKKLNDLCKGEMGFALFSFSQLVKILEWFAILYLCGRSCSELPKSNCPVCVLPLLLLEGTSLPTSCQGMKQNN